MENKLSVYIVVSEFGIPYVQAVAEGVGDGPGLFVTGA